jgi:hypothetical protein
VVENKLFEPIKGRQNARKPKNAIFEIWILARYFRYDSVFLVGSLEQDVISFC